MVNIGALGLSVLYANFVAAGVSKNSLFNQTSRDNCNYSLWLLREKFKDKGIHLNTVDVNVKERVAFELHMDVHRSKTSAQAYLFLWETSAICPNNERETLRSRYRRIFTWDDRLVDGCRYVKFCLPVFRHPSPFSMMGWCGRDLLCCAIAGNKALAKWDASQLYSKRVESIRWFERNASHEFDLFGIGWDRPPARSSLIDKILFKVSSRLNGKSKSCPFPSYRGPVVSKHDTLKRYRFSICYENMSELPGYITEKIFDCFFAGCVPIYWGASNIFDYVPRECFIDRREFADHETLYDFLTSMSEADYITYQMAIQTFLTSLAAEKFYPEAFASNIVNTILADLNYVE